MSINVVPGILNVSAYEGDNFAILVTIKNNGQGANITGWSFKSEVRAIDVLFELTPQVVDAENGVVRFYVEPATLDESTRGSHRYDVQATDDTGGVRTLFRGTFKVIGDVTKT